MHQVAARGLCGSKAVDPSSVDGWSLKRKRPELGGLKGSYPSFLGGTEIHFPSSESNGPNIRVTSTILSKSNGPPKMKGEKAHFPLVLFIRWTTQKWQGTEVSLSFMFCSQNDPQT